ncbi:hypothetical protein CR513_13890, partial [Mucuna pruriens]
MVGRYTAPKLSVVGQELALSKSPVCASRSVSPQPGRFFASLFHVLLCGFLSKALFKKSLCSRNPLSPLQKVFSDGEARRYVFTFLLNAFLFPVCPGSFVCIFIFPFVWASVLAWVPGLTLALGFAGNLSSGSVEPFNSGGSATQGSESQCSASQVAEEGFPFEVVYCEAGVMSARGTPSWLDQGVVTLRLAYTSAEKLVGMADAICRQGPWLVTVSPCQLKECVCEGATDGVEHYFYFYETFFSKLGITLPFTTSEQ